MPLDRREFFRLTAGGVLASASIARWGARVVRHSPYRAIAFDAFPIFDPRPVFALAETLFPGKGADLSNAWRTRQFEYQWLRASAGQYTDFWQTTEDGLVFAAKLLQLELTPQKRAQLMQAYLGLKAWPDVASALNALKEAGIRLALLSNMTATMLEGGIKNAGLDGVFEHVLSTDRIRTYKPDPRAYQMGIDAFKLQRADIVFAAFAGWDVAGAKWFGYPTVWVNRLNSPTEELGIMADAMGRDLTEVTRFVKVTPR
jgi:2-haloacid dehalogenase